MASSEANSPRSVCASPSKPPEMLGIDLLRFAMIRQCEDGARNVILSLTRQTLERFERFVQEIRHDTFIRLDRFTAKSGASLCYLLIPHAKTHKLLR
jgi:hypothetical protein